MAARPTWIAQRRTLVNADPRLVRLEIVTLEKADFVGCHHRRPGRYRQIHGCFQISLLLRPAGALHLQIKALREQPPPVGQPKPRLVRLTIQQSPPQLTLAATGQRDQTIGISSQPGMIDQRNAPLLAFKIAATHQPGQVMVTGQVLTQQYQPRGFLAAPYPHFRADDRLDSHPKRGLVELDEGKQIAHIGHCHGWHASFGHSLD